METISAFFYGLVDTVDIWGVAVLSLTGIAFLTQLYYLLFIYSRIPSHRNAKNSGTGNERPNARKAGVSVIVTINCPDAQYLEEMLPKMLAQDYPDFEIVFVDLSGDEEFFETLAIMAERNPRVSATSFPNDPRFTISNKMALNVGVKAARFDNIIFTTTDCTPSSDKWLTLMARGFETGNIVIGYCGIEPGKGFANKFMRMDQLAVSVRWLSRAMRRKAYAASKCNMGFTKSVYFANNGFNYLNLNMGEDSLFIGSIARRNNTSVVASPKSTVSRRIWGGLGLWIAERRFLSYAHRYYKGIVKLYIGAELWSRFLFFAGTATIISLMPLEFMIFAASMFLLRFFVLFFETGRICRRLSEPGLMGILPLYDLFSPFYEAMLMLNRRFKPSKGLWKR